MELVYLWVEEYKNIEKQGFHFNNRYIFEYNEDQNELKTKPTSKECLHIFPSNINITAIVGKNGSGKSALVGCLRNIFYYAKNDSYKLNFRFIVIFELKNELKILTNTKCRSYHSPLSHVDALEYYTYLASDQNRIQPLFLEEDEEKQQYNLFHQSNSSIADMLSSKYIADINFHLTTFMYLPDKISIKVQLNHIWDSLEHYPYEIDGLFENDKDEERAHRDARNQSWAKKDDLEQLFQNASSNYHRFLIVLYVQKYGDDNYSEFSDINYLLEELDSDWFKLTEQEFDEYFKDGTKDINQFSKKAKEVFFNHYKNFFFFDFIDSKKRQFSDLSHGEQTMFGQMLNIYYYSLQNNDNFVFLLDEPDLALHPEWQRRYLKELSDLLTKIGKKFHIIVTTHSPFFLSDIPKENTIFLKDGKQVEVDIDTFGSNIHTLLSHGFFMEDGLIGEYAKTKINEIIDYLNGKVSPIKDNDEAQKYINIIGEPILKRQLQKMLDSKRISKIDEIDELKKRIEFLEKQK